MNWTATFQADTLPLPSGWQWIDPRWWASDQERNPAWPWRLWFWRNFTANLFAVGIGLCHRKRWWISTMGGENFPPSGWGMGWVVADGHPLPRPWVCRRGRAPSMKVLWRFLPVPCLSDIEFGAGWKSHGGFGINIRRANATNATALP